MNDNQIENKRLSRLEEAVLRAFLAIRRHDLHKPADNDDSPVMFVVRPDQEVGQIAEKLVALGLIRDAELFRGYLRYQSLDFRLRVGSYELNATMTIPEIAIKLTEANPNFPEQL